MSSNRFYFQKFFLNNDATAILMGSRVAEKFQSPSRSYLQPCPEYSHARVRINRHARVRTIFTVKIVCENIHNFKKFFKNYFSFLSNSEITKFQPASPFLYFFSRMGRGGRGMFGGRGGSPSPAPRAAAPPPPPPAPAAGNFFMRH